MNQPVTLTCKTAVQIKVLLRRVEHIGPDAKLYRQLIPPHYFNLIPGKTIAITPPAGGDFIVEVVEPEAK